jgi:hypothetical protein
VTDNILIRRLYQAF